MRQFYVSRDSDGFLWKEKPTYGWSRFPDRVTDAKSMQEYLTNCGKYDPVRLNYVDSNCNSSKIHEVRRSATSAMATINGERKMTLHDFMFIEPSEIADFFKARATPEIAVKTEGLPGMFGVKYLKDHADAETLEDYNTLATERMSDEAVRNYLTDSEVYFVD
jgi:hypothetical protein